MCPLAVFQVLYMSLHDLAQLSDMRIYALNLVGKATQDIIFVYNSFMVSKQGQVTRNTTQKGLSE